MRPWLQIVRTARALGLANVARVGLYRLGLRTGLHPVLRLQEETVTGPFFSACAAPLEALTPTSLWADTAPYFGWKTFPIDGDAPRWHHNPFAKTDIEAPERHWTKISDFDAARGDIKVIWEASRFDWVWANAQRARQGDAESAARLERWLGDWTTRNPAYCGPNWKCGQEASIRVLHLAAAAQIMGQANAASANLCKLVEIHLRRIAPTVSYAIGQSNNHGTSEAAALFIGGNWLAQNGIAGGEDWAALGRKILEERVQTLILPDGTFSQYSVVYHRLLIDTLAFVECWRVAFGLPAFSQAFHVRVRAAIHWLHVLVNPKTGDAPNLGPNDGAAILALGAQGHRDFRPSLQRAAALFLNARAYPADPSIDAPSQWLGIHLPDLVLAEAKSVVHDDGGFAVLHHKTCLGVLRYPRFRFRPTQNDVLHFDLWSDGEAILRDAGSYSYACDPEDYAYFAGTAGHNCIEFDDTESMPRLSRFLVADWIETKIQPRLAVDDTGVAVSAAYVARAGWTQKRAVRLEDRGAMIVDDIGGFARKAVLRWRLPAGDWTLSGTAANNGKYRIEIDTTMPIARIELTGGWDSLYYLNKQPCTVLEVELSESGTLTTRIDW
jgi:Heparinase II/III-like protein/Heparinase II/III N-terminus